MNQNNELYHYGVPGMKWGKRKSQVTSSDRKWAQARYQPSSTKSSVLAGLYAATGNERIGKALDKSNDRDAKRWTEAKQKVAASKKNTKRGKDYFTTHADRMMSKKMSDISLDSKKAIDDIMFPTKKHKNDTFSEKPTPMNKRPNI